MRLECPVTSGDRCRSAAVRRRLNISPVERAKVLKFAIKPTTDDVATDATEMEERSLARRPSAPVLSAKLSSLLSLARICSYIHPAVRQTARPTVRVRVAVQPPSHDRILRSRSLSSFLLHFANCEFLISLNGRNISKFRDDDVGFACKWRAACLSYDAAQQQ